MSVLLAVAVALTALIVTPGYLFYFDVTPKLIIVLVGTAAGLVWMAVAPERGWGQIVRSRAYLPFGILLLANAASLALSAAGSENQALSWFGSSWRRYGAVAQIAVFAFAWLAARCAAGRPDRIRTILRGIAIATAAGAIYGIFQYFGHDPFLPAAAYHIGEGVWTIVRPPGTLGYVSYFATWLLMGAFLCLALAGLEERGVWRVAALAGAPLAIVAMLLTGTRAAMLGLAAGGAVWLYGRGWQARALDAAHFGDRSFGIDSGVGNLEAPSGPSGLSGDSFGPPARLRARQEPAESRLHARIGCPTKQWSRGAGVSHWLQATQGDRRPHGKSSRRARS